jgi:hypothetical protein
MKHHFADFLDRDYWTIVPNVERYSYVLDERINDVESAQIVTIGKEQSHWKQIFEFPNLTELTLHEPNQEQLESICDLKALKRLRISHAKPKNIEFVAGLSNLEECVFEYVSGFSDLTPFRGLTKLKSLHFENLRRVNDYSGLGGIKNLKYLRIDGTLDWNQPIENFDFLYRLSSLEVFSLGRIVNKTEYPALKPLMSLKNLKRIQIIRNTFSTSEYAFLEMALTEVEGVSWELFWESGDRLEFLGKRAGWIGINSSNKEEKCKKLIKEYEKLKIEATNLIKQINVGEKH